MLTTRTLFTPLLLVMGTVAAQTNTWVPASATGIPARNSAVGFSIADKGYVCLGKNDAGDTLTELWQFDPSTEAWVEKTSFPGTARVGAVAFAVDNKAFLGMGADASGSRKDLWEYDPATDAWTQMSDLPGGPRSRAAAFTIGSIGYIVTGSVDGNDCWSYDPSTDVWTQRADMPGWLRTNASSFALDGKGYVALGLGLDPQSYDLVNMTDLWAYDPNTDSWAQRAGLDGSLYAPFDVPAPSIGFAMGNNGYLIDMGLPLDPEGPQIHPNHLFEYEPATDSWSIRNYPLTSGLGGSGLVRDGAAAFILGGKIFVATGSHFDSTHILYDEEGNAYPGPDNFRYSLDDIWSFDSRDCQGVHNGSSLPGAPCNDGDAATFNDTYDLGCTCTGTADQVQPFHPDLIDATFSTGNGFDGEVQALVAQPDGKVIAAGMFTSFNGTPCNGIARLNANGSLDSTFSGAIGGRALALQPDGRILVGGDGITRLMLDGSNDPSYDTYLSDLGTQAVNALVLRPDGRILAGGSFEIDNGGGGLYWVGAMQLMPDGSHDASFNPFWREGVQAVVLRPDGRVIIGWNDESMFLANLAVLEPDGSESQPSSSNIGLGFSKPVRALALRADGGFVVGGEFSLFDDDWWVNDGIPREHIALFDADAGLVPTFDPASSVDGFIRALVVGPQGQIIAGGDFTNYRHALHSGIVQLNDYGYADASFQSGTGFSGPAGPRAFAVQPDGRLIVGGAFTSYNGTACGRITRLRTPGPICLPTQLTTSADPVISCGAVNLKLNGTSTIAATEVPSANKYQFRFTNIPGQPAYARNIAWPTRSFTLTKWYTSPLKAGRTYNVLVRASFDDGATWCDWGPSCTVQVSWSPLAPGMVRELEETAADAPKLLVYPNPTNGDQLRISLGGADQEVTTATLDLTDLFGKRVMTARLPLQEGELNTVLSLGSDLSAGMYLLTITAGEQVFNERLVIAR